jgi:nitrile hydratase accessory protein
MTLPMDIEGPAAPPRSNGELVFAEPWESRAFAMAVALCEAGVFSWREFQAALIARIERQHDRSTDWCYYEHWLRALEDVLASQGAVPDRDVTARATELAQRPAGHDHEQR